MSRILKFDSVQFPLDGERPLPSETKGGVLYVCEEDGCVQFLCPCGCKELRQVPFGEPWTVRWDKEQHEDGSLTMTPSIWHRSGCESHYFIRRNQVIWC